MHNIVHTYNVYNFFKFKYFLKKYIHLHLVI